MKRTRKDSWLQSSRYDKCKPSAVFHYFLQVLFEKMRIAESWDGHHNIPL